MLLASVRGSLSRLSPEPFGCSGSKGKQNEIVSSPPRTARFSHLLSLFVLRLQPWRRLLLVSRRSQLPPIRIGGQLHRPFFPDIFGRLILFPFRTLHLPLRARAPRWALGSRFGIVSHIVWMFAATAGRLDVEAKAAVAILRPVRILRRSTESDVVFLEARDRYWLVVDRAVVR